MPFKLYIFLSNLVRWYYFNLDIYSFIFCLFFFSLESEAKKLILCKRMPDARLHKSLNWSIVCFSITFFLFLSKTAMQCRTICEIPFRANLFNVMWRPTNHQTLYCVFYCQHDCYFVVQFYLEAISRNLCIRKHNELPNRIKSNRTKESSSLLSVL